MFFKNKFCDKEMKNLVRIFYKYCEKSNAQNPFKAHEIFAHGINFYEVPMVLLNIVT
jgi:hypothetical protein